MDENKLFLDEDFSPEDDIELSLDDTSPEELDQLWDDADDELEVCASKKIDKKKILIGAAIAAGVIAIVSFIVYKCIKASRDD